MWNISLGVHITAIAFAIKWTLEKLFPFYLLFEKYWTSSNCIFLALFSGETINISSISEFMLYGRRELPPLADKSMVERTVDQKLFDMYPVNPTIDLQQRLVLPVDYKPRKFILIYIIPYTNLILLCVYKLQEALI